VLDLHNLKALQLERGISELLRGRIRNEAFQVPAFVSASAQAIWEC